MNASTAISAAYLFPIQRTREAVKAFWPVLAVSTAYLLLGFTSVPSAQSVNVPLALIGFAVAIYGVFLTVRGAVSWHRHFILGEPVPWTPLVPGSVSFRYAMWFIAISIIAFPIILMFGFVLLPILGALGIDPLEGDNPAALFASVTLLNAVSSALIYTVILAILAPLVLMLPDVAVGSAAPDTNGLAPIRTILIATAVPLTVVSALSVLLVLVVGPYVVGIVRILLGWYASLVALTGLSLAYRARVD